MDLGSAIALLGIIGIFSYILKDLIRNSLEGLVIKFHPELSVEEWITPGRFGPTAKIERFGVKYTYAVDEDGREVMYENQTIYDAPWIVKGKAEE